MNTMLLVWLVGLPLVAGPAIYLTGRLRLQIADCRLQIGQFTICNLQSAIPPARWLALAALAGTWALFGLAVSEHSSGPPPSFTLGAVALRFDGLSQLVAVLALGFGTLATVFSRSDLAGRPGAEKLYAIVVMLVGALTGLACAADLFNLWVWFELVAIASYLLVGFDQGRPAALEAAVKYLVQGAAGSALVLIGIALVLSQTGTLDLAQLGARAGWSPALLAAGGLFVVGFGVKAALVPMHAWLPDAYTQAPSGASAFLAAVVTKASLVALLRALGAVAGVGMPATHATWGALLLGFGALNMLAGNLLALRQTQVKRLLAYSSLGQLGYILLGLGVAVYVGQAAGAQGALFHAVTHALMSGLAFLAAGALLHGLYGRSCDPRELTVSDLSGAAGRYPLAALALAGAALGLAGLPPLAGFMSKWQIFAAGVATRDAAIVGLVGFAALNSVLSLAYYAPLVNALYRVAPSAAVRRGQALPVAMQAPLAILVLSVLALGVWPGLASWLTEPAARAIVVAFGG